jgi:hypothetical protein
MAFVTELKVRPIPQWTLAVRSSSQRREVGVVISIGRAVALHDRFSNNDKSLTGKDVLI